MFASCSNGPYPVGSISDELGIEVSGSNNQKANDAKNMKVEHYKENAKNEQTNNKSIEKSMKVSQKDLADGHTDDFQSFENQSSERDQNKEKSVTSSG